MSRKPTAEQKAAAVADIVHSVWRQAGETEAIRHLMIAESVLALLQSQLALTREDIVESLHMRLDKEPEVSPVRFACEAAIAELREIATH